MSESDKNKLNDSKKIKNSTKNLILNDLIQQQNQNNILPVQQVLNNTKKNINIYNKNIKFMHFFHKCLFKLSEHLYNLSLQKYIEPDEYTSKLSLLDEVLNKINDIENNQINYFKKNTKILLEQNYPELFTQLKNIIISNGFPDLNIIISIIIQNYIEENNFYTEEFKDIINILNENFITLNINIYQDANEKNKFKNLYNIESLELPSVKNLITSFLTKGKVLNEKIDGASIIIPYQNLIIVCHGLFKKDSLNLCKNSSIYQKKKNAFKDDLEYIDVPKEFKEKYTEQISLRDFIVYPTRELAANLKNDYQDFLNMKSKSLSLIIKDFIKSPTERQRKTLILLLIGDDESKFNANMIFDLIKSQNITFQGQPLTDIIYKSFHWKIQKIFKVSLKIYEDSKKKIENLTINDVPYEARIASLKTTDFVKSKAMDKMKEINGSKENSNKAQQWLDGFLKIPFGVYREEPILKFFKQYQEKIENYIQILSTEIYDFESYIIENDNINHKKYYDILSPIINEFYGTVNEKSENSYEQFIKYLNKILKELDDIDHDVFLKKTNSENNIFNLNINNPIKLNKVKSSDFEFVDIDSPSLMEFNNDKNFDFSNTNDSNIFYNLSKNLSFDSQKILYNILFKKNIINESTLEKSKDELNKFIELKEKILNSSNLTQDSIELLDNKLKELEELIVTRSFTEDDLNNDSTEFEFQKFVYKNKKKIKNYVDEWNDFKQKKKNYLKQVENTLDKCTYGQFEAKKQMKRLIAQWMNGNNAKGSCIGLQGPPGVGKTSLLKHGLSKCLVDEDGNSRPLIFIPIGGSSNGSFLEGHNYTYLGSTWGKIADALMEAKCMNPIIFIDELDKISKTEHGKEIASILTHITDETQNHEYFDRYFASVPIDLSRVLFVFSYNDKDNIDPILRDRIQEIKIKGLSKYEKIVVCKNYILPEIYKNVGFGPDEIIFSNETLGHLIEDYTFEEGARRIKEILLNMVREINLEKINGNIEEFPILVNDDFIKTFMEDKRKIKRKVIHDKPMVGLCNGLYAVSGSGSGIGGITPMQMMKFLPTEKKLSIEKITGSCGDDMIESVHYAFTLALNLIPEDILKKVMENPYSIHVHCGDSGQKSGPSAGAVLTTTFVSLICNIPIKNYFAGTSEINLMGKVTAIGGLEAKLNGAIKAGCTLICISKENEEDLRLIIKKDQEEKTKMYRSESMKNFDLSPLTEHESFDYQLEENKVIYKDKLTVYIVDNIIDFMKVALVDNDIKWNDSFITKDLEK